jgi:hypothetical protein
MNGHVLFILNNPIRELLAKPQDICFSQLKRHASINKLNKYHKVVIVAAILELITDECGSQECCEE